MWDHHKWHWLQVICVFVIHKSSGFHTTEEQHDLKNTLKQQVMSNNHWGVRGKSYSTIVRAHDSPYVDGCLATVKEHFLVHNIFTERHYSNSSYKPCPAAMLFIHKTHTCPHFSYIELHCRRRKSSGGVVPVFRDYAVLLSENNNEPIISDKLQTGLLKPISKAVYT